MATGFAAVRAGIIMFTIPFVFAFYPELLLIEQAQLAQSLDGAASATKTFLPGYNGTVDLAGLGWLLFRLAVALYLVASALSRFDQQGLTWFEVLLRLALGALVLWKIPVVANGALVATALYLIYHHTIETRLHREPAPEKPTAASVE